MGFLKLWDKTFGKDKEKDNAKSIIKTRDGYLIVGFTDSLNSHGEVNRDAWIIKIDENGNKLWDKTFGGKRYDEANSIIKTNNGYLIVGSTDEYRYEYIWVIKLDKSANELWKATFKRGNYGEANSVIEIKDSYLIVGATDSLLGLFKDVWVIKIKKLAN